MEHLKYPIGRFAFKADYTPSELKTFLTEIEELPEIFGKIARSLTPAQLDTPYRPEGWTARQVIHHVADSHMNAYVRTKLALTEDTPVIKPYKEDRWALLNDYTEPIGDTLELISWLHRKWMIVLRGITEAELSRAYFHPESQKEVTLAKFIQLYAWHGKHHTAHLRLVGGY
jgi:hypothetical protein